MDTNPMIIPTPLCFQILNFGGFLVVLDLKKLCPESYSSTFELWDNHGVHEQSKNCVPDRSGLELDTKPFVF